MSSFEVREIDDLTAINGGTTRLAGAELGIESFGMQVFDFPPDFEGYPEHDHGAEGQEEVYTVLAGSADFVVDGEPVPLVPGRIIRIAPASSRRLLPGPDGVRILAIGSVIDGAYERPAGLSLPSD